MEIKLGEKIRALRKKRNLSQEVLANYLGVSFQAVSKWENGDTMPDVAMIPAIAAFFEVSTDELFDFNRLESEAKVQQMCWDIAEYRYEEPERAEQAYRGLLRQYPGNDVILANLLYALQIQNKHQEVVAMCKTLMEATRHDDIRFDTARILAETYKELGEYQLCKEAIDMIPEFFFSHREIKARLLDGEDMFRPAWQQKEESACTFVDMIFRLADYYEETGDVEKATQQLKLICSFVELMKSDITPPFWRKNFFNSDGMAKQNEAQARLKVLEA